MTIERFITKIIIMVIKIVRVEGESSERNYDKKQGEKVGRKSIERITLKKVERESGRRKYIRKQRDKVVRESGEKKFNKKVKRESVE